MAWRVGLFFGSFLLLCGAAILFPAIDLRTSAAFYVPGRDFPIGGLPLVLEIHHVGMRYLALVIAAVGLALIAVRRWRAGIFLLLALALGPGLVVNVIFKDHWGRARPAQLEQFGGEAHFTPAFVPSDQCEINCSFPAGDPANGFVLVAAGFLATRPRRRRALIATGVGVGLALGFLRIAAGGHFLSDVLASGYIVFGITWLLYRWIIVQDGLPALAAALRHPPPGLRRFLILLLPCAAAVAASIQWLDRPLCLALTGISGTLASLLRFITGFGVSTPYLVVAAGLAIAFGIAAARAGDRVRRYSLALAAWRSIFVFAAVAGTGLAADLMKPLFGRARPKLFLEDHIFGFTWHGAHAAYWSFPSGHTVTIVALGTALGLIDRRWRTPMAVLALLVMASRIMLGEHYLSDVIAAAFIAWSGTIATGALFRRAGVELALNSP